MKLWIGMLIGLCLPAAIGAGVIATGLVDLSAASTPGAVERALAPYARDRWIAKHVPRKAAVREATEEAVEMGREHYRANCIVCHAAPAIAQTELAQGMNPPPPRLDLAATQKRSDGELFWIVSQGIRMTGMPAFSRTHQEPELWNVVAFLRRLPRLTDQDRAFLRAASTDEEGHHHDQPAVSAPADSDRTASSGISKGSGEHPHGKDHDHHHQKAK